MTHTNTKTLAPAVQHFFAAYLPCVRGLSPHTIRSYRDTFSLLLRFMAERCRRPLATLDLDDLDPELILTFLDHLEHDRTNQATTRNVHFMLSSATSQDEIQNASSRASAF